MDSKTADRLAFKLVLYSLIAVVAVYLMFELKALILTLILSLTLAAAISPLASQAEKIRIPRVITVVGLYILIVGLYILLAANLAPMLKEQAASLYDKLPNYLTQLETWYTSITGSSISISPSDIHDLGIKLLKQSLDASAGVVGALLNGLLVLFLSAFFVVEADAIQRTLFRWLPASCERQYARHIIPVGERMGGYVRGQLLTALVVAIYFAAVLTLIGVPYGFALGGLAGLLNLVPYVGSISATALALLVASNHQPDATALVVKTLIAFTVEQWLESNFIVPFLLGRQVQLHPLVVLLAMIAGAALLGIIGAIVSVPIVSALMYLAEELYLKPKQQSEAAAQPTSA